MISAHIDFETYSPVDLKSAGLHNYAINPFTGVHCLGYCFDDSDVELFDFHNERMAEDHPLLLHVASGGEVVAHNAAFEFAIWNNVCVRKYGWPLLRLEQMRCTMAQAYAMALPGSLKEAALALGIDQQKDMVGARVMMQLAKPKTVSVR